MHNAAQNASNLLFLSQFVNINMSILNITQSYKIVNMYLYD